ncbi:Hint domain-containing protein [Aestuariispira insulae]|uniref:Hint domain-containing protein n=1 Tax=Aestuariispira insulae TaxID=1461337 RepID=A0A3D9H5A9_9PROT|nr:Hint domain-containing protein [Aestuariispira insulae]RED44693.1 hypothetical protein DFP90_11455 [Aestuariispira insulae]
MASLQIGVDWKIYGGQKDVPFTAGVGQHNYLILVDGAGTVRAEFHGYPKHGVLMGGDNLMITEVFYDANGSYQSGVRLAMGPEDRSNWVEIPLNQGRNTEQTWNLFRGAAAKYSDKFDYQLTGPGHSRVHTHGRDEQPTFTKAQYNSNTAYRTLLDEAGYKDYDKVHPDEGFFESSPGDQDRLPELDANGQVIDKSKLDASKNPDGSKRYSHCFAAGTSIELADGGFMPIEEISLGDEVAAYTGPEDATVPGRVTQLHKTEGQEVLSFHGIEVTPGHQFLTPDGSFKKLADILAEDGMVVGADGQALRARTGCPVGGADDQVIPVGHQTDAGVAIVHMRAGTPYGEKNGRVYSIREMMEERGYHLRSDGRFVNVQGNVVAAWWDMGEPDQYSLAE